MIAVGERKIIKTEQNIALFASSVCFGLKKEAGYNIKMH